MFFTCSKHRTANPSHVLGFVQMLVICLKLSSMINPSTMWILSPFGRNNMAWELKIDTKKIQKWWFRKGTGKTLPRPENLQMSWITNYFHQENVIFQPAIFRGYHLFVTFRGSRFPSVLVVWGHCCGTYQGWLFSQQLSKSSNAWSVQSGWDEGGFFVGTNGSVAAKKMAMKRW